MPQPPVETPDRADRGLAAGSVSGRAYPYNVLLYYCFAEVEDPVKLAESETAICVSHGLRGRIIVAPEGINGTISGLVSDCEAYQSNLARHFPDVAFKSEPAERHAFKSLKVKVRQEIVTMAHPIVGRVEDRTAQRLSPAQWQSSMSEPDTILLDGRNKYESDLGHFIGAVRPPLDHFRDFPRWLIENRAMFEGRKILTYCTGGIRCEKLTAWMLQNGFENVYQLDGGIVKFGQDPVERGRGFAGVNVVFDERVVTPVGDQAEPVSRCESCGTSTTNYVNCANVECNKRLILCPTCEAETRRSCSPECRCAPRRREKGERYYDWAENPDSSTIIP